MLNWNVVNKEGITIKCVNERETIEFLQECEKKNIKWASGLRATESSKSYRTISTNGGKFLTEEHDNLMINYADIKQ